jgi:LuxR family maltose regulon positive regulatory protein
LAVGIERNVGRTTNYDKINLLNFPGDKFMTEAIIKTNLHLPFTRPKLVSRPRLQDLVAQGLRGPLTLVTAPAGFGKTTLVASYFKDHAVPAAWLSLDINDNQPERFLRYLIAALQSVDEMIGKEAVKLLDALHQLQSDAVLTSLVNDLDESGEQIVLVLDDYQYISSKTVHDQMAFLLEYCPNRFHIVITTRSDPMLPLTRLRARGQLVEIRAADLRFRESETVHFLNDIMNLHLDTASVSRLEQRTEGWIVGLQMAALSMRDRKDVLGFIEGFSGTNRYILDYLLEEVLARQSPEIQNFLLITSILDGLTAPLCDCLLTTDKISGLGEQDDRLQSSLPTGQSASILEYLERANLFLIPLDDEGIWFRYHHLFADLLNAQLRKSFNADTIVRLHTRAAEWHGQNGSVLEAIQHASLASNAEMVERFIQQNYIEMVSRGEMTRIRFWISKLSRDLVYSRPWLCIYEAFSYAWFGELDEALLLLDEAEKRFQPGISTLEVRSIQAHLAYVKSRITAMHGDIDRAIALCLAAREYTPESSLALQLDTLITLGYEYFLIGDFANAVQNLNETIRLGKSVGAVINTIAASCVMARLYAIQGLLHKSYDTYQIAAGFIPDECDQHLGARALVEIGIADLFYEWNDLEAALAHIQEGLTLISMWDKADDLAMAYITLGCIHLALANFSEAQSALDNSAQLILSRGVFCEARHLVNNAQVKFWLKKDNVPTAKRWIASQEERLSSGGKSAFENELFFISQARVMLAMDQIDEALSLLSHLEKNARKSGRNGRLIEILMLKAVGLQRMGEKEQALGGLAESLLLAEPQGYVRTFLDEGQPMRQMIAKWLSDNNSNSLQMYASHLLTQFESEPSVFTIADEIKFATNEQTLIEPLSRRELEVLELIALGKTNQEVAQQLVVSRGTIKAHAASIYRKLDVTNRTAAVARARQLGILS